MLKWLRRCRRPRKSVVLSFPQPLPNFQSKVDPVRAAPKREAVTRKRPRDHGSMASRAITQEPASCTKRWQRRRALQVLEREA